MLTFEQAGKILDEACEALPPGLFDKLNGGVSLQREERRTEDGRCTLGLYHNDELGRWIEIFYGSVRAAHGLEGDEAMAESLRQTLRHELTHHIEGLAGDRSLIRQDERETEAYLTELAQARFQGGYRGPGESSPLRRRARPIAPFREEEAK